MKRNFVLEVAYNEYTTYGIKKVSMDQLVQKLKISKKTVYEYFFSKDELALECVKEHLDAEIKRFKELHIMQENPLRGLMVGAIECYKTFSAISAAFYDDLRIYPNIERYIKGVLEELGSSWKETLKKGIKEGYVISKCNLELFERLFRCNLISLQNTLHSSLYRGISSISSASTFDICSFGIFTMLRGISTPKGLVEIDKFENEYEYTLN